MKFSYSTTVLFWNFPSKSLKVAMLSALGLTHLTLTSSRMPITTTFGEFTRLTNLQLQGLRLVDATKFRKNIFNCPVLEKLKLICCSGLSLANFDAPNLKCLDEISPQITFTKLENLARFSFCLTSVSWPTQTKTSNLVKVISNLHKIEKFTIGIQFIKVIFRFPIHFLW